MITQIGMAAGAIWQFLDEHGASLFSQMVGELQESTEVLFMALGWLARESHIVVNQDGTDYRLSLRSLKEKGT